MYVLRIFLLLLFVSFLAPKLHALGEGAFRAANQCEGVTCLVQKPNGGWIKITAPSDTAAIDAMAALTERYPNLDLVPNMTFTSSISGVKMESVSGDSKARAGAHAITAAAFPPSSNSSKMPRIK